MLYYLTLYYHDTTDEDTWHYSTSYTGTLEELLPIVKANEHMFRISIHSIN